MSFHKTAPRRSGAAVLMALLAFAPSATLARAPITAEQVQQAIVFTEDPLEVEATFSTRQVLRSTRGLIRTPYNDGYLKAAVHRGTGEVRYEMRQTLNYDGPYRGYRTVNYEAGDLPKTAGLRLVDTTRGHCEAFDSGTACLETVAFEIPEAELWRAAETTGGQDPTAWQLKFKPALGRDHRAQIPRAEILGLLRAVESYRAARTFSPASVTSR